MGEVTYNKLVRDNVPAIIRQSGHEPVVRELNEVERVNAILEKVREEASELIESNGDLYEFADTLTALKSAIKAKGYTWDEVEQAETEKSLQRGGFNNWVFLEKVVTSDE